MAKTVVLIDDDQDDLDVLKEAVQEVDPTIICLCFMYPEEAIRVISRDLIVIPDFVFTDINMPGMTGDQCIRELRKVQDFNNTIIAVVSTSLPSGAEEAYRKLGANYSFQKPSRIQGYHDILRKILN